MKTVWITGASSGIGEALAKKYADNGWQVIASARNVAALDELHLYNEYIKPLVFDVSQSDDVSTVKSRLEALNIGQLDVVIANAGVCEYVDIETWSAEAFQQTFDVNVVGVARTLEIALPLLQNTNNDSNNKISQIAIVSSLATANPFTRAEAYGASKAALNYLAASLKLDLYGTGTQVCLVQPGFVQTPLTDKNTFSMPFIVSQQSAANTIYDGLLAQKSNIAFPKRLHWTLKLLSLLPMRLLHKMTVRTGEKTA